MQPKKFILQYGGWFNDFMWNLRNDDCPFIQRGGNYSESNGTEGIFKCILEGGNTGGSRAFRTVLCP